jgi:hypothetical protein
MTNKKFADRMQIAADSPRPHATLGQLPTGEHVYGVAEPDGSPAFVFVQLHGGHVLTDGEHFTIATGDTKEVSCTAAELAQLRVLFAGPTLDLLAQFFANWHKR